jgi:hypothetical protein
VNAASVKTLPGMTTNKSELQLSRLDDDLNTKHGTKPSVTARKKRD